MEKHDEHTVQSVDLTNIDPEWFRMTTSDGIDEFETCIPAKEIDNFDKKLEDVGESFVKAMISLSKNLRRRDAHCKVCGGLKEEIAVDFESKRYFFTCFKVESLKTQKILLETDYQKFSKYGKPKPK